MTDIELIEALRKYAAQMTDGFGGGNVVAAGIMIQAADRLEERVVL